MPLWSFTVSCNRTPEGPPKGAAQRNADEFWYEQPARGWMEALPIGNGRFGAMVFGDPSHERIQLNEDSISGIPPGWPNCWYSRTKGLSVYFPHFPETGLRVR
ncbi:glycoside hydrolase N-terminal domain-containing protein [Sinomicrobium soli]|uniref:glycoside hydrolase N-terminal domain-containing protein n=1 Tax=Sinomicrobium sp. N-1-3-6 TaxID=2219864 RepID=UPI000DCBC3B8|nr:glycoside hydrolase N-terminal domain-containing protein [Sinomicrobium sp. N-1-3-6]RAV30359.1 hypothetical protein DN748_02305 [Sinomicrobium sp. N-1-3-6]